MVMPQTRTSSLWMSLIESLFRSAIVLIVAVRSAPPENFSISRGHCLSRCDGASTSVALTGMKALGASGGGGGIGTRGAESMSAIVMTVLP